ncbi:uncharacterized protein LOC108043148 [Drosophila rhopaloa]|uniref:Uncharacterized protein n=1 Tax=Drosophila rhopaloa TaxID=1041015 RepID=A0ABM5HAK4_DRORH|nr:uncharacterized protein LOC108043148 [Drosophila rhopaloa]
MADAIRCACDSLNSVVDYLVTMRICEIRHCLEFLGVAHTEVLAGVVLFVLMQFTKFTAVLLLAILLAYGIFYLWDTYFPEISQFGHRGMKMFRNVRTSANLPPFTSDTEESPGEYFISPKVQQYTSGMLTPPNAFQMPTLLPMLPTKNMRTTSLQTDRQRKEEENRRGSRGRAHASHRESQDPGRHRQERPFWRSVNPEPEREHHSSKRASGSGGGSESKRMSNVLRIPNITSGVVDTKRLPAMTSEHLKRLPNITSGEERRIPKETRGSNESKKQHNLNSREAMETRRAQKITSDTNESRKLPNITSGEMKESRRGQGVTSNTNDSRRLPNITSGEVKETRKSSHPRGGGESRRSSQGHRDGGGGGESKARRPSDKSHPAQGRRPEEQSKQRRSNNGHSGVTKRQFPEDHYERLKIENREYQARRLQASGPAVFRQISNNPTFEGALLTKQDNFIASHRQGDRRETQRKSKSSNQGKDDDHRYRAQPHRLLNPIL